MCKKILLILILIGLLLACYFVYEDYVCFRQDEIRLLEGIHNKLTDIGEELKKPVQVNITQ